MPPARPWCVLAAGTLLAGIAALTPAQTVPTPSPDAPAPVRRILVDRDLTPTPAALAYLDDDTLGLAAPDAAEIPTATLLAILPDSRSRPPIAAWFTQPPRPGEGTPAVVELTDGQVLLCRVAPLAGAELAAEQDADDAMIISLDGAGVIAIPLERVARVRFDVSTDPDTPTTDDEVELRNGDRLAGFVVALGHDVTIEVDRSPVSVPADDVLAVRLANPPEPAHATLVSLANGSVLAVNAIERTPTSGVILSLALAAHDTDPASAASESRTLPVALTDVLAVRYRRAAGSLLPLSETTPEGYRPTGERRWTPPPRAQTRAVGGVGDVSLPGPMAVRWTLPDGAQRFATTLALGPGEWADCELYVEAEQGADTLILYRTRLRAAAPTDSLAVDLPDGARTITIRVEPGERGPIQDAVRLVRPMVLINDR